MRTIGASLALASTLSANAHDGHGAVGNHIHAGDLLGLAAMALVIGLWLWRRREH